MPWTEGTIVAEFQRHIPYWQEKLRMRDIQFRVAVINSSDTAWVSIDRDNGGENFTGAALLIRRDSYHEVTQFDVWETVAHELVHAMNWSMSAALEPMKDHFAVSQLNMANSLLRRGNEILAYKWESILSTIFAADAPRKEIPT